MDLLSAHFFLFLYCNGKSYDKWIFRNRFMCIILVIGLCRQLTEYTRIQFHINFESTLNLFKRTVHLRSTVSGCTGDMKSYLF